jgi:hypothetical protein
MIIFRLQVAACIWTLLAGSAAAEGAKLLFFPVGAPEGIKVVPPTSSSGTTPVYWNPPNGQWIIPRYANGSTHPAGQLVGWGPTSVVQGTADTQNRPIPAVVVTEDYDKSLSQWQGGAAGKEPAVMQVVVRDLTIVGHDNLGGGYPDGVLSLPSSSPGTQNRLTGPVLDASGTPIQITTTPYYLPTGAEVTISGVTGNLNANGTFTVTSVPAPPYDKFTLNGTTSSGTYTGGGQWTSDYYSDKYDGLLVNSSGPLIENVQVFAIPGTAMVVTRGGSSLSGQLRPFDREKTRVWNCVVKRAYRGIDVQVVDSIIGRLEGFGLRDYGLKISIGACQIDGALHFYGIGAGPAIWFATPYGDFNWGGPIYGESSATGVFIESNGNMLHDIYSHTCWEDCIRISGARNVIRGLYINLPFSGSQPMGVRITGQYNTINTGDIYVPASSTGVLLADATGQQLLNLRLHGGSGATLIDLNNAGQDLNYCTIDILVDGGALALDLRDTNGSSRIGDRNTIRIRSPNGTPPTRFLDLPDNWHPNNNIEINGIRVNRSITGMTGNGVSPIEITSVGHGLATGDEVFVGDVLGNTAANTASNSLVSVTVTGTDTFSINGTGNGNYTTGTGWWGQPR